MLEKFNSRKSMLAALAVVPLFAFFALAASAGGPEPVNELPDEFTAKKGKIKGLITIERNNVSEVKITLEGKCKGKEIASTPMVLCDDCFPLPIDEIAFQETTEEELLDWLWVDIPIPAGCFKPYLLGANEFLFISQLKKLDKDTETNIINASVTLGAILSIP